MNLEKVIQDLLDEGGVDYKRNGRSFILRCPRCSKREKLYVRKTDGRFVCWVCKETEGFSGAPEWALTELLGIPVAELRARLYGTSRAPGAVYIDLQLDDFFEEGDDVPGFVQKLTAGKALEVRPLHAAAPRASAPGSERMPSQQASELAAEPAQEREVPVEVPAVGHAVEV